MDDFMAVTGGTFKSFVHPCDEEKVEKDIERQISSGADVFDYVNYRIVTKDETVKTVEEFGHRLQVPGIGPVFYVFFLDSSARYVLHDIDGITGLPGQTRFLKEASLLLSLSGETERKVMLYMNIRNFRMFNLLYSSRRGNEFLEKTALILKDTFPDALISRFSDDHFAILTGRTGVEEKIDRAYEKIMALREDVDLAVKFGLYVIVDGSMKPEIACDLAKTAADSIKDNYQLHLQVYTDKIGKKAFIKSYVMDHLQEAMDKKYIQIYLQPVIRTISGTLASVEALSRWNDPTLGMISPGTFIPLLEESRQIKKLDLYVLEEICRLYRFQVDHGKTVIPASFNLSRIDFFQGSIFEEVEEIRERYQVPRNMLYVEVTESAFVHEGDVIRNEIDRFRAAGYEVWMDDFGSGYSSLNTLKDYSFDEIKIDMAFLSKFTDKSKDILKAIVRMAKGIGIHTLVEGVETEEQRNFICSIGCELIQGYYYGKPMPFAEFKHVRREKGWQVETPQLRRYYGSIGGVDFLTDKSMAVAEFTKNRIHYLFANKEFRNTLKSAGLESLKHSEDFINAMADPISKNLGSFMKDIALSHTDKSLTYTENGQYMKLDAKYMAADGGRHLAVLHLSNITIHKAEETMGALDWVTRNLFYLYQTVSLVDPENNTAIPLVNNTPYREYFFRRRAGIREMVLQYADTIIHPDDRKRFMEFNDLSSILERVKRDPFGTIIGCFRTLGNDHKYHWDIHSILPVRRKGKVYLLYTIRNSPLDEKEFRKPLLSLLSHLPTDK